MSEAKIKFLERIYSFYLWFDIRHIILATSNPESTELDRYKSSRRSIIYDVIESCKESLVSEEIISLVHQFNNVSFKKLTYIFKHNKAYMEIYLNNDELSQNNYIFGKPSVNIILNGMRISFYIYNNLLIDNYDIPAITFTSIKLNEPFAIYYFSLNRIKNNIPIVISYGLKSCKIVLYYNIFPIINSKKTSNFIYEVFGNGYIIDHDHNYSKIVIINPTEKFKEIKYKAFQATLPEKIKPIMNICPNNTYISKSKLSYIMVYKYFILKEINFYFKNEYKRFLSSYLYDKTLKEYIHPYDFYSIIENE